jgi:myo-inositol-1(or 4)-monophosphatase
VDANDWQRLLATTASEVRDALDGFNRWGEGGERPDQYALDQVTDAAALRVLTDAGVRIFSEESGLTEGDSSEIVIVDPVDGSTNASQRIPYYCTSLCVVDSDGPLVGYILNLANGEVFEATRGGGATLDGQPIEPSACADLSDAIVGLSGWPNQPLPSRQFRAFGACALDLASVASGRLDAFADPISGHGVWDYVAGLLICSEAGAFFAERDGLELIHLIHGARRGPIAAATATLCDQLRSRLERL